MARIYIETTVISFYFNARPEPEMVARQNWTRRWLDAALTGTDELVTSLAVETELSAGEFPPQADMLALCVHQKSRVGNPACPTSQGKRCSKVVRQTGLSVVPTFVTHTRWRLHLGPLYSTSTRL